MEGEALITQNLKKKFKLVRDFRVMYRLRWNEMISSAVYCTLEQKKWNAPQLIPLADDVEKNVHMYSDEKQKQYYNQLCDENVKKMEQSSKSDTGSDDYLQQEKRGRGVKDVFGNISLQGQIPT